MRPSKGLIFTSLSALSWAINIVLARLLLSRGETAGNLAFWQTLFTIPYWTLLFYQQKQKVKNLRPKLWILLLVMGLVNMIGVVLVEALALKSSPAVNFSFLIRTVIVFTILLAAVFLKESLTLKKLVLTFLILAGSYLLITQGQSLTFQIGDFYTILEALLLATLSIMQKTATTKLGPKFAAAGSFLFAIIPFALLMMLQGAVAVPKFPLATIALAFFYIAIMQTKLTAFKSATASYGTMIFSFTPIFVSLLAIPFLGETLTPIQIIGGILIVSAGVGVEKLKI